MRSTDQAVNESNTDSETNGRSITSTALTLLAVLAVFNVFVGAAAAQTGACSTVTSGSGECNTMLTKFRTIGNIVVALVALIAIPNGAYGFLEWMTASDSVDQDERGRRRIRNTFIALGGVGVLRAAVELFIGALL